MKLALKNTSRWPTPFVRLIARWLMTRQEFVAGARTVTVRVRHTNRVRHGRAWLRACETTLACTRRCPKARLTDTYTRYAWAAVHELRTPVELLVKILAHELRHLDPDNQRGTSRQGCEHDAEHWAWCAVLAWRDWWPAVGRGRYRARCQRRPAKRPMLTAV